jgi:hypothetical protein
MSVTGIPVVLADNGTPVTPSNIGTPVTIVGGNAAPVKNGQALAVPVTGTYTTTATFTVVAGAITAIALS